MTFTGKKMLGYHRNKETQNLTQLQINLGLVLFVSVTLCHTKHIDRYFIHT